MTTNPTPVQVLESQLAAVLEEAKSLRNDVQKAERARRRGSLISAGLLALLLVFTGGLAFIGAQSYKTADKLADCTMPGGKCYAQAQSQQVRAISAVTRISVLVSQCGRLFPGEAGPEYDKKLEQCVAERLAEAMNPPTTPGPQPSTSKRPA